MRTFCEFGHIFEKAIVKYPVFSRELKLDPPNAEHFKLLQS